MTVPVLSPELRQNGAPRAPDAQPAALSPLPERRRRPRRALSVPVASGTESAEALRAYRAAARLAPEGARRLDVRL